MTARHQKILVIALTGAIGAFLAWLVVNNLVISRAGDLDREAKKIAGEIDVMSRTAAMGPEHQTRLKEFSGRMLQGPENQIGGYLAATVMTLLDASHLGGRLLSSQPLAGKLVGGSYKEIGQAIHVRGRIENIVSFLYLLDVQPYLHRLDNLAIGRDPVTGEVDLNVHYSVLIPDTGKGKKPLASQPTTDLAPNQDLQTPQRREYDAIVSRALLRPYVKRIAEVTPAAAPIPTPFEFRPRPTPPPPPSHDFAVCGLVTWSDGTQDVCLRDTHNNETRHFKPGEKLPNGAEVVMIDYRSLPAPDSRPDAPKPNSSCRVIMRIGPEYWAVDMERTLSDKRLMKADHLPVELRPVPASAPAELLGRTGAVGR
jgi:hypothetical protein